MREFGGVARPCILFGSRVFHLRHRTSTSTSTSTSSDRAYDIGGSRCVISLYLPSALVELELELIQSHMAQKPMLRDEVPLPKTPPYLPFPRRTPLLLEVPPPLARAWLPQVTPPLLPP